MRKFRPRDLRELTLLGRVTGLRYTDGEQELETEFVGEQTAGVALFWSKPASALVFWSDADDPPNLEEITADDEGEHAETWRTWTRGFEVDGAVEAMTPRTEGQLRDVGPALWIDYDSEKWGRPGYYRHRFGPGVVVACTPGKVAMWVLQGGDLEITSDGIEG